jgi:lysozyme
MNISDAGLSLIKQFEGCKLIAYQDQGGVFTCGWGSTGADVVAGAQWTQAQADARLVLDAGKFSSGVSIMLRVAVNQNQFDALCSFAYNLGLHTLSRSHLMQFVNESEFGSAALQFPLWDHCGGVVVQGLLNRRLAEQALFKAPPPAP